MKCVCYKLNYIRLLNNSISHKWKSRGRYQIHLRVKGKLTPAAHFGEYNKTSEIQFHVPRLTSRTFINLLLATFRRQTERYGECVLALKFKDTYITTNRSTETSRCQSQQKVNGCEDKIKWNCYTLRIQRRLLV